MKWFKCFLALSIVGLIACQKKDDKSDPPPAKIETVFVPIPLDKKAAPQKLGISVAKSSLGQEFMLSANLIMQDTAPLFGGLKTKVVYFRQIGPDVVMFESSYGHNSVPDLNQKLLLAKFPVVEETDQNLVIDFGQGMSDLYALSDWDGAQVGSHYEDNQHFQIFVLKNSFIASLEYKNNAAIVEQVSSLSVAMGGSNFNLPVVVKYYLAPYEPKLDFKVNPAPDQKQFGFFSVHPLTFDSSEAQVPSTKFDISEPVVFALSANTPAQYKQAITEGVLYWNKAFGQEILKVVDAPPGVSAPSYEYNVIQWTDSDVMRFAYADAQSDPRNGQIKHAQIFVSSVFTNEAQTAADKSLKNPKGLRLQLRGFDLAENGCRFQSLDNSIAKTLQTLRAQGADDQRILKVAQDYVRLVVAHEVGHTLGLRHNFAGSVASTLEPQEKAAAFKKYLDEETIDPNLVLTASIMDYGQDHDEFMTGNQMGQGAVMEYDQKAIQSLYFEKSYALNETPLFCTDEKVGRYHDCQMFDSGSSFVKGAVETVQKKLSEAALQFVLHVVAQIAPAKGVSPVTLSKLNFSAEADALRTVAPLFEIVKSISIDAGLIKVEQTYAKMTDLKASNYRRRVLNLNQTEIKETGGFEKIFSQIPTDFVSKTTERTIQLLNNEYRSGKGLSGQNYELTEQEIAYLSQVAEKYFSKFAEFYNQGLLSVLAGKNPQPMFGGPNDKIDLLADHPMADDFAAFLAQYMENFITQTTDAESLVFVENPGAYNNPSSPLPPLQVKLSAFKNSFTLRSDAAKLLDPTRSQNAAWGFFEKKYVSYKLHQFFLDRLTLPISQFAETRMLSRQTYRWFFENKKIMSDFPFDEKALVSPPILSPAQKFSFGL